MPRKSFDQYIVAVEREERFNIWCKMRNQFQIRLNNMRRKESSRKNKADENLEGIVIDKDKLEKLADEMNLEKKPNYVILGDIHIDMYEKEF